MNWPRAWINDALVTSIRDGLRPGTIVAMEPEASTTAVSRALCTVIVHMPSVSWTAFAGAVNSAQEHSFFGQPRAFAADGIRARVTGEEAMESSGVSRMPSPVPLARSSQRSESGSQIW